MNFEYMKNFMDSLTEWIIRVTVSLFIKTEESI